jgi:hypothetical protein
MLVHAERIAFLIFVVVVVDARYMMGQEGYCLTTLETAVSYLVSSDINQPCSPT